MEKMLAVTAIGPDRTGLIKDISEVLTASGCNILESRMIALGSEFAALLLAGGNWHAISKAKDRLERLQEQADLTLTLRDAQPRPRENTAPYLIDIVTLDHEGIVLSLAGFFAARGLEIAELNTRRYNAPHTGATMFSVQLTVNVPADTHIASLREDFFAFCDVENLDAVFEPAQR